MVATGDHETTIAEGRSKSKWWRLASARRRELEKTVEGEADPDGVHCVWFSESETVRVCLCESVRLRL
ncbi:hypothetical protein Syun_020433 [Stephania yunnanensis]|uniref:Uncharacterized protein n=1 Tax=Stephania yunnanensis TaxID=152371 RepID=A0AAP0NRF9_9MAGN